MQRRKVLLIGFDSATLDLIVPWAKQNKLPTLRKLLNTGVSGVLESTVPPSTPPAWTSIASGKNPGKHGLYGFFARREGTYEFYPVNRLHRKTEVLWNILSRAGKRVIVVNYPMTYPPERVNGLMVSGMLTPSLKSEFTYPAALKDELLARSGADGRGYKLELHRGLPWASEAAFLREVYEVTDAQANAMLYLMEEYEWDFFVGVFMGIDRVSHRFWKYMDPQHPSYNSTKATQFGDAILHIYQKMDNIISAMLGCIDEDERTNVIIVSDHGHGPLHKFVYLNNYFLNRDLLKLKNKWIIRLKYWAFKHGLTVKGSYELLAKIGLSRFIRHVPGNLRRRTLSSFLSFADVDWDRTIAYSMGDMSQVFINLEGREPRGVVEPGAGYERARDRIISALREFEDPVTGKRIVDRIIKKDDVYTGEHLREAPDLFIIMDDMRYMGKASVETIGPFGSNELVTPHVEFLSGSHRPNGIIILWGDAFNSGTRIEGARAIDVAPTILHIMGIPVPEDMDGKVLYDALREH